MWDCATNCFCLYWIASSSLASNFVGSADNSFGSWFRIVFNSAVLRVCWSKSTANLELLMKLKMVINIDQSPFQFTKNFQMRNQYTFPLVFWASCTQLDSRAQKWPIDEAPNWVEKLSLKDPVNLEQLDKDLPELCTQKFLSMIISTDHLNQLKKNGFEINSYFVEEINN